MRCLRGRAWDLSDLPDAACRPASQLRGPASATSGCLKWSSLGCENEDESGFVKYGSDTFDVAEKTVSGLDRIRSINRYECNTRFFSQLTKTWLFK